MLHIIDEVATLIRLLDSLFVRAVKLYLSDRHRDHFVPFLICMVFCVGVSQRSRLAQVAQR